MIHASDTPVVQVDKVNRHYRGLHALEDVSFTLQSNVITGLLGRNGAGKTTLMKILTAQEFPSSGIVRVFGENPTENDPILRRMVFIKEGQVYPDVKVRHVIDAASWFYPSWNAELAAKLVDEFELPLKRPVKKVSRGMHSAIGIVIGMAARAEITLFDEPYLGLDAVARQAFYDHLLADYVEFPADNFALHPPDRRGQQSTGTRADDQRWSDRGRRAGRGDSRGRGDGDRSHCQSRGIRCR